jgi:GNAT superfamily N-acetyltransferase
MTGSGSAVDAVHCRLVRYLDVPDRAALTPALDAIFFEASARQSFADPAERAAFRECWLGRYLTSYPGSAFLALAPDGMLAGYLVGCLEDAARLPVFADIEYFRAIAAETSRYPAHLHINLRPRSRGVGLGQRLIAAFAAHAHAAGVAGMHVVTARGMRNISFYRRCGFHEAAAVVIAGRELVMLARSTAPGG